MSVCAFVLTRTERLAAAPRSRKAWLIPGLATNCFSGHGKQSRLLSTSPSSPAYQSNDCSLEDAISYFQKPHKPVFITTPIYYVNAAPHIGHLYSTLLADTINRHFQSLGASTIFTSGTDEHGLKVQQAVQNSGLSPQEFCDRGAAMFRDLFGAANINVTRFIRTTDPDHVIAVSHFWDCLQSKGLVQLGSHKGWYSVSDEVFVPPKDVEQMVDENGNERLVSRDTRKTLQWLTEENFTFDVSPWKSEIESWLKTGAVYPPQRVSMVRAMLSDIDKVSMSRPAERLHWAVPVPACPSHTVYVWVDALTNYLTCSGYPCRPGEGAWPADYHIIGKDIAKFHAIYWPAFLLGAGLDLPRKVVVHGHWLLSNTKMSKSLGNVVDPFEVIAKYGTDQVRYYLLKDGKLGEDTDYSDARLREAINGDLADTLGNLLSRSTGKAINPSQSFPSFNQADLLEADQALLSQSYSLPATADIAYRKGEVSAAIQAAIGLCHEANRYFQGQEPWRLNKAGTSGQARSSVVVGITLQVLQTIGIVLLPVMPNKMNILLDRLAVPPAERTVMGLLQLREFDDCTKSVSRPLGRETGILFERSWPV